MMKQVCAVAAVCSLLAACGTTPQTPEQNLAKQLAHCGVVADNLSKSDPKYKQWASNFMGAAATLASNQEVLQMMMADRSTPPVTSEQRTAMEKEAADCQTLLFNNMDKFGGAKAR
jgi:hypothetical protein